MPIYPKLGLIFIAIPKTGGTSITTYLKEKDNPLLICNDNGFTNIENDYHSVHYTYMEIIKTNIINNYNPYIFFCVVRNPYYKILSALNYHKIVDCNTSIADLKSIIEILFKKTNLVVTYLKMCNCGQVNYYNFTFNDKKYAIEIKHLLPQSDFLKNSTNEIQSSIKILYFENLKNELINKIGLVDFDIHENKGNISDYDIFLTDEVKKLIYDRYQEDFVNFGYSF
jgi:hypothetical protein